MGIRFYCPNGHRLHVKSFLAGKRGICPHCTARFRIPPESEIPHGAPKIRPDSQAGSGSTNGKRQRATSVVLAESMPAAAQARSAPQSVDSGVDPIAENPEAIWYVRPPSGGQYGPAKGDVMRQWLAEGRVSPDSLVWREGWSDWLTAGPVFPALHPTYTVPPSASPARRETVSLQLQPSSDEPAGGARSAVMAARPVTQQKSLAPVIILVLTVLVLLVVLVVVLSTKS